MRNTRRHGKATSSGVESANAAIVGIRGMPTLCMIESSVDCQRKQCRDRKEQGLRWVRESKMLTEHSHESDTALASKAQRHDVAIVKREHPFHKAKVSCTAQSNPTGHVMLSANVDDCTGKCPCLLWEETGAPLVHLKALLLQLGQ